MEKKQTAVEWLFSQLPEHLRTSRDGFDMLNQAKAMEKEQTIDSYTTGMYHGQNIYFGQHKIKLDVNHLPFCVIEAEEYYTETYENQ